MPPVDFAEPAAGVIARDGGSETAGGDHAKLARAGRGRSGIDDDESTGDSSAMFAKSPEFASVAQTGATGESLTGSRHGKEWSDPIRRV